MDNCKVISIKWKEEDDFFKKFHEAKRKYDQERKSEGFDKETSCAEFARKLIISSLNLGKNE
ncbi:MAG: hypothetical protein KAT05_05425 [Spirochaetes bacterium]|nr:hypothetical protein [Spirochaetota bacterium]